MSHYYSSILYPDIKAREEEHLSGYDRQPHFFSSFIFWIYSEGIMP